MPRSSTETIHVCHQGAGVGGVPGDRCVLGGSVSAWTWTSAYRGIQVMLPDLEPTGFLSPRGSLCEAQVGHEDPQYQDQLRRCVCGCSQTHPSLSMEMENNWSI